MNFELAVFKIKIKKDYLFFKKLIFIESFLLLKKREEIQIHVVDK
jgi:hypothetical protein